MIQQKTDDFTYITDEGDVEYFFSNPILYYRSFKTKDSIYFKWYNHAFNEENNILYFKGFLSIYTTAYLPNYSFYLNVDSTFMSIKDINLTPLWAKGWSNSLDIFRLRLWETYYKFEYNIDLTKWSKFDMNIQNFQWYLNYSLTFNQNVLRDYNISVDQQVLNLFIRKINKFYYKYKFTFYNCLEFNSGNTKNLTIFFTEPYWTDKKQVLFANSNHLSNNIVEFARLTNKTKDWLQVYKPKLKLEFTNSKKQTNTQEFDLIPKAMGNDTQALFFDKYYEYNSHNNEFTPIVTNKKGLYATETLNINSTLELYVYQYKILRKLIIHQEFTLKNDLIKDTLEKMNIKYLKESFKYAGKVNNE